MSNRAVFLDRDGTINEEVNYLNSINQLKLIDGVREAIQLLNNLNYRVIVVTNQAAVARGYLTEIELIKINETLAAMLMESGAKIDAIYYCPHHPTEGKGFYRQDCKCRKPQPGMLLKAADDFNLDLKQSFTLGDKITDLIAGRVAGCRTILVLTGYGRKEWAKLGKKNDFYPDYIAPDLFDAVQWITRQTI